MAEIKVNITFGGNANMKTCITIRQDASVEDLLTKVAEWNGLDVAEQRIAFGRHLLQITKQGRRMYLSDYYVHDRAEMWQVATLSGGNDPKQLPDDVELSNLPDMITWDDDPNAQRAKMPCGHVIGPESLTAYCRRLLSAGMSQFYCPYIDRETSTNCGQIWEYFTIRRLAALTEDEMKEFETKLARIYLRKSIGMQECPKCSIFCMRKNSKDRRVVCPWCRKEGRNIDFCWNCLGDWKTSGTTSCGNTACTGKDPRLKILEEAPRKEVVGVEDCPSIRACPKCGLLIQHRDKCKHMVCTCGQKFCFICLKEADSNGEYQCGSYKSHCNIAPIQTKIIGADADDNVTDALAAPLSPADSAPTAASDAGSANSTQSWCTVM